MIRTSAERPQHQPVGQSVWPWVGLVLILVPLLARATSSVTNLPAWDLDPTIYSVPGSAIGPAGSMLVDGLALMGAALLFIVEWRRGRRVWMSLVALAMVSSVVALLHGWVLPSAESAAHAGSLGNQRIGVAWIAAVWSGLAIGHAARDGAFRRATAGVMLGFIALLALRGAQEVFIEHASTMAAFRADPKQFLEQRGWSEGSAMALSFVRRISQADASGWFGLSNAYASFAAFGVVVSFAWLVCGQGAREKDQKGFIMARVCCVVSLALSVCALYLSHSKGGLAVAVLGVVLVGVAVIWRGAVPWGGLLGLVCVLSVIGAIGVRGVIGERVRELSILFRAFYIEAAIRIFAAHPVTGVGPDGFQQAYLIAKNPLSPEEVSSPHSILFDWIATLGLSGLGWCVLLVIGAVCAGRTLLPAGTRESGLADGRTDERPVPGTDRENTAGKAAMLTLALSTIIAAWMQSPYITMDVVLVRVGGLAIGCWIAWVVSQERGSVAVERGLGIGLGAGALAVMAHAQLEVTFSFAGSAGLAMIACALGTASVRRTELGAMRAIGGCVAGCAALVLGVVVMALGIKPAYAWQQNLESAAAHARVVASFGERLVDLSGVNRPGESLLGRERSDDLARIAKDLSAELGRPCLPTQTGISGAMLELEQRRLPKAIDGLRAAMKIYPTEWRVAREASRLHLRLAFGYLQSGNVQLADNAASESERVLAPPTRNGVQTGSASWLRALAVAQEAFGAARNDRERLSRAISTLERAAVLDPYNLDIAVRMCRLHEVLGNGAESRQWAARALELDRLARLDLEVRGLSALDRREVEAIRANP